MTDYVYTYGNLIHTMQQSDRVRMKRTIEDRLLCRSETYENNMPIIVMDGADYKNYMRYEI